MLTSVCLKWIMGSWPIPKHFKHAQLKCASCKCQICPVLERRKERRRAVLWTCGMPCKHELLCTFIFYFVLKKKKKTFKNAHCIISNKLLERLEKYMFLSLCSLNIYCINIDWMMWGKLLGKGTCTMLILTRWPVLLFNLSIEMRPQFLQYNHYFSCKTS